MNFGKHDSTVNVNPENTLGNTQMGNTQMGNTQMGNTAKIPRFVEKLRQRWAWLQLVHRKKRKAGANVAWIWGRTE